MVSIPRMIFGPHLALIGIAFLVWCGSELEFYGGAPVRVSIGVAAAAVLLLRPRFVLTSEGLEFAVKIFFLFSVSYASIPRGRILGITGCGVEATGSSTPGSFVLVIVS